MRQASSTAGPTGDAKRAEWAALRIPDVTVGHNTYIAARGRVSQQQTERDIGHSAVRPRPYPITPENG